MQSLLYLPSLSSPYHLLKDYCCQSSNLYLKWLDRRLSQQQPTQSADQQHGILIPLLEERTTISSVDTKAAVSFIVVFILISLFLFLFQNITIFPCTIISATAIALKTFLLLSNSLKIRKGCILLPFISVSTVVYISR